MANNFVSRGEVLTLTAPNRRESGNPYREHGFNGVALIDADQREAYTLQTRGVFEFPLKDVFVGDRIYIDKLHELHTLRSLSPPAKTPPDNESKDDDNDDDDDLEPDPTEQPEQPEPFEELGHLPPDFEVYGRAVTGTDGDGNFHCLIQQS